MYGCVALLAGGLWAAPSQSVQSARELSTTGEPPALVLHQGSIARRELVVVGRDLVIHGHAHSDVAAVRGNVTVEGRVDGDVISLGGDVRVGGEALIRGSTRALGGVVDVAPGARVEGRIAAYPGLHPSMLTLFDGPALGVPWWSPALVLLKVGLTAAWVLWGTLCALFAPRALRRTAVAFDIGPLRLFAVGLGVVLTLALTILLVTAILPGPAALPMVVLLALVLLGLKLWGVAALGLYLGRFLTRTRAWPIPPVLGPMVVGMLALNLLRMIPVLGFISWAAFTLVAVGATVRDRLSTPPVAASG